jgi:hypothetical protein
LAQSYPRYGYPTLHDMLRNEGLVQNAKRTYRIYREEGLQVRRKRRKKLTRPRVPMAVPTRVNERWSVDFADPERIRRKLQRQVPRVLSRPAVVYQPGRRAIEDQRMASSLQPRQAAPIAWKETTGCVRRGCRLICSTSHITPCSNAGVRSMGSTLWTEFKLHGEGEAWFARERARRSMNDFVRIRHGRHKFRPEDSVELHETSRTWLVDQFEQPFDGPTVVVTHHLPASASIAKRYANDPLKPAFASRLEGLIEEYQPALWIHGHTHDACDYELFRTRIVCNPRGYPGEYGLAGFKPELTVVV